MSLANCFKKAGKALDKKDREAIQSLVDGGMSERDAVIQHLGGIDSELSGIADEVERAGGAVDRAVPESRTLSQAKIKPLADNRIATRTPTAVKSLERAEVEDLSTDLETVYRSPNFTAKLADKIRSYGLLRKLKPKKVKDAEGNVTETSPELSDQEVIKAFKALIKSNLLALYDAVEPEIRERSKLWYDGARKQAEDWAARYGIEVEAVAGVMAALSPQKDWFMNQTQAERVLDIMFHQQDTVTTPEMEAWAAGMVDVLEAQQAEKAGKEKAHVTAAREDKIVRLKGLKNLKFSEITDGLQKAIWLRAYDESHNPRSYRIGYPEGGFGDIVITDKGAEATHAWGSYNEIMKAISVIEDPRPSNISKAMGAAHKVRNFYNNIVAPQSMAGDVTMDTHAIAAALWLPLSSKSTEVLDNLGGIGDNLLGLSGTYAVYADAYREAAKARGVLPREMQSITWEAVRGLFTSGYKAQQTNVDYARDQWLQYRDGKQSLQATHQRIIEHVGGKIQEPFWYAGPTSRAPAQRRTASYERNLPAVSTGRSQSTLIGIRDRYAAVRKRRQAEGRASIRSRLFRSGGGSVSQSEPYGQGDKRLTEVPDLKGVQGRLYRLKNNEVRADYEMAGATPTDFYEITDAAAFRKAILKSKKSNAHAAAVEVKSLKDYRNKGYRMFVSRGGESGFAIGMDGDIVSLFKQGDAPIQDLVSSVLPLAIQQGGTKLDAFDTYLPILYSRYGFKAVARVPFNEQYMPEGWRFEDFKEYKDGRPDVVLMVLDPKSGAYQSTDGKLFEDFDEAAAYRDNPPTEEVRVYEQGNRARTGRGRTIGPTEALPDAPSVSGFSGPDPRLVRVAEDYAKQAGITLKRQADYVDVDPERAKRLADAYEQMEHAPQDPAVREAYENLIQQTLAQYKALEAAGYKFWFVDPDREDNLKYLSSPWNAMRDVRANQSMGVYPTDNGFGTSDFDPAANPLLADTGIQWPVGGPDGTETKPVLANDLFRAVHDAFGHGLEGAGFRARGEENAWQAHVRLFTGSAVAAITSETRGQNSWLNYGPYGETNRTASVEDTVFADQKTGLMPEWTWTEGRAADMEDDVRVLEQQELDAAAEARGQIEITMNEIIIRLGKSSDSSTFIHEAGHLFLELEKLYAIEMGVTKDQETLLEWLGVDSFDAITVEHHEKFARGFEQYFYEGKAPSHALREVFASFRRWIANVYRQIAAIEPLNDEIRGVFDRMLASEAEIAAVKANPQYDKFFTSAQSAGMTAEAWAEYEKAQEGRAQSAEEKLFRRMVKQLTARKTDEWKAEKELLITEEIERLEKTPIYVLLDSLATEGLKLDRDAVKSILGVEKLDRKKHAMLWGRTTTDPLAGRLDPALVAEEEFFNSAEEMLQAILNTPKIRDAAEQAAEQRMIKKYGDILNDGTIDQLARDLMQSNDHAQVLLREAKFLQRKTGNRSRIDRKYLEAKARETMKGLKYREIKPERFYRNMTMAATAYGRATTDEQRLEAKTQQLANHYLFREATRARQGMEMQRKFVRKTQVREVNTRNMDSELANQIYQYANMYEMRDQKEREKKFNALLLNWYEGQRGTGGELFVEVHKLDIHLVQALVAKRAADEAGLKVQPYVPPMFDDLTVEELQSVYDQIKHMQHIARVTAAGVKEQEKLLRDTLNASIDEKGGSDVITQRGTTETRKNKWLKGWSQFTSSLTSLRNMVRSLDGFEEDGFAYKWIYREIEDGNSAKLKLTRRTYELFQSEVGGFYKAGLGDTAAKSYTRQNGKPISLRAEDRFMIALYYGTESSREALREGYDVTDADLLSIMSDLTPEQLKLVNAVWRVNESLWPELSQTSIDIYGIAPPKLDATPFIVNGVEMTGGHMRLFYDSQELEMKQAQDDASLTLSMNPGKAGSLHARLGGGGRVPKLDMNNIARAIDENIHFIAFAPVGRTLRSRLGNRATQEMIQKKHGNEFHESMVATVNSIINGKQAREEISLFSTMVKHLRTAVTAKHLMLSLRNTIQGLPTVVTAMHEVGPMNYISAATRMANGATNGELAEMVRTKSAYMENRTRLINREASELLKPAMAKTRTEELMAKAYGVGFMPQIWLDGLISYPLWISKYEQAMLKYGDEATAISMADTAVHEAVGGGSDLQLSRIFQSTNGEFTKTFTMFGSYFNAYYQRLYRSSKGWTALNNMEFIHTAFTVPLMVSLAAAALIMDFPEDEDQDDLGAWLTWMTRHYSGFLTGTVPLLRDLHSAAWSGFRPSTVTAGAIGTVAQMARAGLEPVESFNNWIDKSAAGQVSDILKTGTTFVPVPGSGMVINAFDYIDAVIEGEKEVGPLAPYEALVRGGK